MSVRIGLAPGLRSGLSTDQYWRWVDLCEQSGIDSLWHSDQLLGRSLEPVSALAALAGRTRRMRFGTSAIVTPFRDPVVLAKQFATIDFLSSGRLLPVLGVGNASDAWWQATGTSAAARGARTNEAITLLRLLLEQDEVAFEGRHYRYLGPGVHPRPAKPVPLWIGGNSPAAFRRTAELGDGWLGSMTGPDAAGAARKAIEAELERTGRSIDADHYGMTLMCSLGDGADAQAARDAFVKTLPDELRRGGGPALVAGSARDVVATLRRYVDAGISKFVLVPLAKDGDGLIAQTGMIVDAVVPAIERRAPAAAAVS